MQIIITTTNPDITEKLKAAPFESKVVSRAKEARKNYGKLSPEEWQITIEVVKFAASVSSAVIASWIYGNIVKDSKSKETRIEGKTDPDVIEITHTVEEKRTPKTTTRKEETKIRIVRSK